MPRWRKRDREKDRQLILHYHSEGLTRRAIAEQAHCSTDIVDRVLKEAGLQANFNKYANKDYCPTPEEIAAATAEIRKGWGIEEYEKRAVVTPERRTWADRPGAWEAIEATNARGDLHRDEDE